MMYIFRTKSGTFTISPDEQCGGMFQLCIGGMWLGTYETPEQAAESLVQRKTGWFDWDRLPEPERECGLADWDSE